jgi:hypothetical protein
VQKLCFAHRPEGFLEKLVVPLKPSGRFPSFLRRYVLECKSSAFAQCGSKTSALQKYLLDVIGN